MSPKKILKSCFLENIYMLFPCKTTDFINQIVQIENKHRKDFIDFNISISSYDDDEVDIYIEGVREETDTEYEQRLQREKEYNSHYQEIELTKLNELAKKYGKKIVDASK